MSNILKFYGTNIKISGPFRTIPLEWFTPAQPTYSNKLLRPFQAPEANRAVQVKLIISVATLTLLFFQGIQISLTKNTAIQNSILSWMLIFMLTVSNFFVYVCRKKSPEFAAFINGLIQFDKLYPKKASQYKSMTIQEIACVVTVHGLNVSQVLLPFGVIFGFHWIDPWKPSLAGYWLIPISHGSTENFLTKITALGIKCLVLLYNYWMWNFVLAGTVFAVGLLYNLCVNTILESVDM